jgi:hypothetical protein
VNALRRLQDEGIHARLFAEGFRRTCLRVEATVFDVETRRRAEEVRQAVRLATMDPFMRVNVIFVGGGAP